MSKGRLADLFYETETEFFGLPPFSLLDEVGEGVVTEILKMFERCPTSLRSQIDFLSEAQIEAGCGSWSEAVEQTVSRTFELFESYSLKNVLLLPEAFKLPHRPADEASSADCEKIDEELHNLLAELNRVKTSQRELKLQQERLSVEEEALTKIENQLDGLDSVLKDHSIENVASSLASITKEINVLKEIVADTLESSSNAFAFDDGETPKDDFSMAVDTTSLPMDNNMMLRLLEVEMKACHAIGNLSDIKALL